MSPKGLPPRAPSSASGPRLGSPLRPPATAVAAAQPGLGLLAPDCYEQALGGGLERLGLAERVTECQRRLERLARDWRAGGPLARDSERCRAWVALLGMYEVWDAELLTGGGS